MLLQKDIFSSGANQYFGAPVDRSVELKADEFAFSTPMDATSCHGCGRALIRVLPRAAS